MMDQIIKYANQIEIEAMMEEFQTVMESTFIYPTDTFSALGMVIIKLLRVSGHENIRFK